VPEPLSAEEVRVLLRLQVADLLDIDASEVAYDAELTAEQGVDSLLQLELMTRVEQQLHLTFDIDAWLIPTTLAELAQHIHVRQAGGD